MNQTQQKPDTGDKGTQPGKAPEEAAAVQDQLKDVVENGAVTTNNGRHVIHCLTIIGQIEGHYALSSENKTTKYEHVIPQLVAIEESREIEGLLILLNTVGGDIEAGLAVAAKKSFIAPSATMTIHPVRINGLVLGVPQAFTYFQRMQERITRFVTDNSGMSFDRFTELCMNTDELATDVGSVLDGEDAVKEGLIDSLGSLSDAIAALYAMIDESGAAGEQKGR